MFSLDQSIKTRIKFFSTSYLGIDFTFGNDFIIVLQRVVRGRDKHETGCTYVYEYARRVYFVEKN
jgi:hypothetical protein